MAKQAINFFQKHLSLLACIVGIIGGIAGMWTAVSANTEHQSDDRVGLETRLVRVETKVDMIINILKNPTQVPR